ncbi:MAG: hypothetical protein ACKVW3_04050 [Phycisphaerales bacterium]
MRFALPIFVLAGSVMAQPPAQPSAAQPVPPAQPAQVQVVPDRSAEADAFLGELESADKGLLRLVADVKYQRSFELVGDRQTRFGRLAYVAEPSDQADGKHDDKPTDNPSGRKFAVTFDRFEIGSEVRNEEKSYIFDGHWLVEKIPGEKLFKKHEVVPPGERFDPLRIGQGPFPVPIGQRRADIVARFEVDKLAAEAGLDADDNTSETDAAAQRDFATGTTQIRLTPRPGTPEAEDFREVRLWYLRDASGRWLPRMAKTINPAGDASLIFLINVRTLHSGQQATTETEIPAAMLDTTTPEAGWDVSIQRWAGRAEPLGGP